MHRPHLYRPYSNSVSAIAILAVAAFIWGGLAVMLLRVSGLF